ncbi:MAG: OsmC family protein [Archangium sp.]
MATRRTLEISLPGGRRVDARVGEHLIHTHQPRENGGTDSAPSPFEIFLASIGTCAGIFVQGFCAKRDIPFEDIRIQQHIDVDEHGVLRSIDLDLRLPPTFPERYRNALVQVVDQCSVKKAIAAQPAFTVRTSTP